MAMASECCQSDQHKVTIRRANCEKTACALIDSFLESKNQEIGVPLSSIIAQIREFLPEDIVEYIKSEDKNLTRFIIVRKHLWTTRTDQITNTVLVQMQSDEHRRFVYDLSAYIQGKGDMDGMLGCKLRHISEWMHENYRSIRRGLGKGLEMIKRFLLGFYFLFEMIPYDPRWVSLPDIVFTSRGLLVDDVILLPEHIQSFGHVTQCLPQKNSGFVRDEQTQEYGYFLVASIQPTVGCTQLQQMMQKGQRFQFDAIISVPYLEGRAQNKWKVVRMRPVQMENGQSSDTLRVNGQRNDPTESISEIRNDVQVSAVQLGSFENEAAINSTASTAATVTPKSPTVTLGSTSHHHIDDRHVDLTTSQKFTNLPPPPGFETFDQSISKNTTVSTPAHCEYDRSSGAIPKNVTRTINSVTKPPNGSKNRNRNVEKRDVGCQTEFKDDKEMLLKLFRESPDLMAYVRKSRELLSSGQ